MNNMEEKLWEYIDGTCSEDERLAIAALIEKDAVWGKAFNDMVQMDNNITELTLDEPPMAFSFNVMEGIRAHEAGKPLKTSVNNYLIGAIAGFLVLTIVVIMVMILADAKQNINNSPVDLSWPNISTLSISYIVKAFFYVDIMLMLFLADAALRRRRNNTIAKSV